MKKMISVLLCLAMALALTACGTTKNAGSDSSSGTALPISESSEDTPENDSSAETSAETSAESSGSASSAGGTSSAETSTELQGTSGASGVSVTYETKTDNITADDGTDLLDITYVQPTVTVEGNEAAQQAIQADLDQVVSDYLDYAYSEMKSMAQETYEYQKEEGGEFAACFMQVTMETRRADSAVLSITAENAGYTGGAHPSSTRTGLNYDVTTGERITFATLGDGFRDAAEKKVLEKAADYQKENGDLFEEYADYIYSVVADGTETVQSVMEKMYPDLYGADSSTEPVDGNMSPTFFMDETGVGFISNCEMQPYATGILEFHVDYSELADAMNAAYIPA